MTNNFYPDLSGTWSYRIENLRRKNPTDKPQFSDIIFSEYDVLVEQKNKFIIVTVPANPPLRPVEGYQLGLINKVYSKEGDFWQITIADFDDTGVINLTIKESCDCGHKKPIVLEGYYVESGFSTTNPDQNQAVAQITWTKK